MNGSIQLTVPNAARATLRIEATIKDFQQLKAQLETAHPGEQQSWPLHRLLELLREVINKAEAQWTVYEKE